MVERPTRRQTLRALGGTVVSSGLVSGLGSATDSGVFPIDIVSSESLWGTTSATVQQTDDDELSLVVNGNRTLTRTSEPPLTPLVSRDGDYVVTDVSGNLTGFDGSSGWYSYDEVGVTDAGEDIVPTFSESGLGFVRSGARAVTNIWEVLQAGADADITTTEREELESSPFVGNLFWWPHEVADITFGANDEYGLRATTLRRDYGDLIEDDGSTRAVEFEFRHDGNTVESFDIAGWLGPDPLWGAPNVCVAAIYDGSVVEQVCKPNELKWIVRALRTAVAAAVSSVVAIVSYLSLPALLIGTFSLGPTLYLTS
jgi:hypothetical protein